MSSKHDVSPGPQRFTYADYLDFPDDGQRYEILDGVLEVSSSPRPNHQRVLIPLVEHLARWARHHRPAEVFVAPIDLILADDTVLVPDLLVVEDRHGVTDRAVERAPVLVVEVLSPSTAKRDRGVKRQRYARAGVREYWVVDPKARTLEQFVLEREELIPVAAWRPGQRVLARALSGFEIDVASVFENLDPA